ncbi:hypothetical protein [Variovorax sp. RCC_210]|uniref:hypothetical protein n=1 Tax=Variovorax sp. RCC_210 TaxID=3239217 RepID=UPI00352588AC
MATYEFTRRETARFAVVDAHGVESAVIQFTTFERRLSISKDYDQETPRGVEYELADGSRVRLNGNGNGDFDAELGIRRYFVVREAEPLAPLQ